MSASLIGRLGSSAFRLSTPTVSMSLTGSCFSSESAPRPFQYGIRIRGGTIFRAALPSAAGRTTLAVAVGTAAPSHAITGTVRVTVAKAGFIVGAGGGKGVLTFRHRNYPFTVQGLSLGLTAG